MRAHGDCCAHRIHWKVAEKAADSGKVLMAERRGQTSQIKKDCRKACGVLLVLQWLHPIPIRFMPSLRMQMEECMLPTMREKPGRSQAMTITSGKEPGTIQKFLLIRKTKTWYMRRTLALCAAAMA